MSRRILHGRRLRAGVSLRDAIQSCAAIIAGGGDAYALLYSPRRCVLGRLRGDGRVTDTEDREIPLDTVYEARLFGPTAELRWLNGTDRPHRAALLSEDAIPEEIGEPIEDLTAVDRLDRDYLLWGQGTGHVTAHGWSRLATSRIGPLMVPVASVGQGERVHLKAFEYLKADEDGNVTVAEERLAGWKVEEVARG